MIACHTDVVKGPLSFGSVSACFEPEINPPPLPLKRFAGQIPSAFDRNQTQLDQFLSLIMDPTVGRTESRLFGASVRDRCIYPAKPDLGKRNSGETLAGWFSHPGHLIVATQWLRGVSTYVIPNPCEPEAEWLKGGGDNAYTSARRFKGKDKATTDKHIPYLRFLFTDFDYKRTTDTSSTDEEIKSTFDRRDGFLGDWPTLIPSVLTGCSGNGAWVLTRLPDLPNDEAGRKMVERMTLAIMRIYSDEAVEIDAKCRNPSRLMCLPGTVKCKGKPTNERPWRLATLDPNEGASIPIDPESFLEKLLEKSPEPVPEPHRTKVSANVPTLFPEIDGPLGNIGTILARSVARSFGVTLPGDSPHLDLAGHDPLPGVKKRAWAYLKKKPGAISGEGGHNATFDAACVLVNGFNLSFDDARPILKKWSDEYCIPPWSDQELSHKLHSAIEKADRDGETRGYLLKNQNEICLWKASGAEQAEVDDRFQVIVTDDEKKVVDICEQNLAADETIFQQTGQLLHLYMVPPEDSGGRKLCLAPATYAILRDKLSGLCEFKLETDDGIKTVAPPHYVPASLLDRKEWPTIPYLNGIVYCPTIRTDGTLLRTPGYDDASKLIYDEPDDLKGIDWCAPIPGGRESAEILLSLVDEFPWPTRSHAVAWLSSVLTLVARHWIGGTAPMFVIDANSSGAGKSHLAQIGSLIARGSHASLAPYSANDEEMRKRVTALAMARHSMCLMDNIDRPLGGASLDAALTARTWTDRILCSSKMAIDVPLNITWFATGNNMSIVGDIARRVVYIRLDSPLDRPAERGGYRIADILGHVAENRATYLKAAIDIIRGYVDAGSPRQALKNFGSFERWTATVRSAVYWATGIDPLETRQEIVSLDDGQRETESLVAWWSMLPHDGHGLKVRDAIERMQSDNSRYGDLLQLCRELAGSNSGSIDTKKLGIELKKRQGKSVAGLVLRSENYGGTKLWRVVAAGHQPASGGD